MLFSTDVLRISTEGFSGEASGPLAIISLVIIAAMVVWTFRPR